MTLLLCIWKDREFAKSYKFEFWFRVWHNNMRSVSGLEETPSHAFIISCIRFWWLCATLSSWGVAVPRAPLHAEFSIPFWELCCNCDHWRCSLFTSEAAWVRFGYRGVFDRLIIARLFKVWSSNCQRWTISYKWWVWDQIEESRLFIVTEIVQFQS